MLRSDYVKLTFASVNNSPIYFQNDEHFGLGLFRHQDFASNKSGTSWDHSSECYDYSELDSEIFHSTNLKSASVLFVTALILSAATLFFLLALKYKGGVQNQAVILFTVLMSAVSAALQILVFSYAVQSQGNAVCSTERYSGDVDGVPGWYVDYPVSEYPNLAYMRFFSGCELGSTGKLAITGFVLQLVATFWAFFNSCYDTDADTTMVSQIPVSRKLPVDEESPEEAVAFETNPKLGYVARSPRKPVADDKFADDMSFDRDVEDEINGTDDVSLATGTDTNTATEPFIDTAPADDVSYSAVEDDEIDDDDDQSMSVQGPPERGTPNRANSVFVLEKGTF